MNRFALLTLYRSLTRHRLYAALNIGGLAVGIAVFLVLGLYVRFETSFEKWLPHHNQIYLVESRSNDDMGAANARQSTPIAAFTAIKQDLPGTIGTRIQDTDATVTKDGMGIREDMALVDPDFFKLFDIPVITGDAASALTAPGNVIITRKLANKYFGIQSPIGKTLTIAWGGTQRNYRVSAVIADLPANTDLAFGLLARLVPSDDPASPNYRSDHQWNYDDPGTYVRLPDAGAVRGFENQLAGIVMRHAQSETPEQPGFTIKLSLKPLTEVRFEKPGSKLTVATLGTVGLLTLLIAVINYINLASARAGLRAREVAMRKVMGADRATLARHYIGEAIIVTAVAALLGVALAELGLPLVNAATGLNLKIDYLGWNGVIPSMTLLVIVVGLIAGIYPAIILSSFPAAAVLASSRSPGGGSAGTRIREVLVVFQFTIAIAFIIGTMVLIAQTRHVRAANLGYDRSNLLLVRSLSDDNLSDAQRDNMLHRLAALPGVTGVSNGNSVPGNGFFTSQSNFSVSGQPDPGPSIQYFETTPGYFHVLRSRLLAGRLFDPSRPGDANANLSKAGNDANGSIPANVILNESAVHALHFASPQDAIGKTFGGATPKTIIGVIADMRFNSPRKTIPATMYDFQLRDPQSGVALVRFIGDGRAMLDAARQAWLQSAPQIPFSAATAGERLQRFYISDDHAANLFTIGAVLAVLIGCVGLWGLASFNTTRRVKEIGIRKVLGASSADVVRLLVKQFLRPVLISNLFAWPLAYVAMRTWLTEFDDRIALSPLYFIGATALGVAIAVLTVLAQSLRAARATPAWALRHE